MHIYYCLFILIIHLSRCESCPGVCRCYSLSSGAYTVDCYNRQLTNIPSGIPSYTTTLNLAYNRISFLNETTFQGLSMLQTLYLFRNQLISIHPQTFNGLSRLQYLYLSNNRISFLNETTFQGLSMLKSLRLYNNQLISIHPRTFNGLSKLQYLHLNNNPLRCGCNLFLALTNLRNVNIYGTCQMLSTNISLGQLTNDSCDIDECIVGGHNCDINAVCTNKIGSFSCRCKNGYSGNGTSCSDIDECAAGNHNCDRNAICSNTIGSFSCACNNGYSGIGTYCSDVDECTVGGHNCDINADCTNKIGSSSCRCKNGYSGNGTSCSDIDECAAGIHNCDINAICTNNIGSFSCACNNGYSGFGTYCSANCLPPQTSETSRAPLYSSISITCVLFLVLTAITVWIICKKRRTKVKEDRSAGSEIALGTINQASAAIYQNIAPLDNYQSLSPYRSSQLEFPRECLHLEGSIGSGQFGNVKLATIKGAWRMLEGKQVAIKELKENATDAERNTFLEELNLMKGLSPHQNMVTLLGCVTRSEPVYILVEYTPYGDLLGYLKSGVLQDNHYQNIDNINMNILTKNICILFAQDIANGMEFLASNQVVHRDLAGRNILVFDQSGRKTCKITDLGLSRSVYNTGIYVKTTAGRLPLKWMAPESIIQGEYSTKSDVWAYGIVLFEIFTKGETPYLGMSNLEVIERLKIGYKLKKPDNLDNEIYDIMLRCWCTSPTDRPTFTQLKSLFAYNRQCEVSGHVEALYEEAAHA